ncbi:MAG TPA: VTT domain-containing protein [Candidatus Acidoferrum sp.]|nr:VTT domain-containing protein [Candidatus Acidoferrum sp.]
MHGTLEFLVNHGYLVLLVWVFFEQAGLPLPSIPLLLAAGALGGMNRLNFGISLLLCVVAAVSADTIWYELGRRKGIKILQWLCKISLEPDSCVRRTEGLFERQGAKSLLVAKFLPGLNTVATPLAGIFHMRFHRFLSFDALGALLWAGTYLGLGYVFSGQIEKIALEAQQFGGGMLGLLVATLACYVAYKFVARQKFLRELRISRISPEELKEKLDAGESLTIVDLRHSVDFEADPETIPGAFRMDARELEQNDGKLPPGSEIILYCT